MTGADSNEEDPYEYSVCRTMAGQDTVTQITEWMDYGTANDIMEDMEADRRAIDKWGNLLLKSELVLVYRAR